MKAARFNTSSNILELFLKHDANPNIADNEGNTPMHCAAIRGNKEVATFLIKLGADPYARNYAGNTPSEECTKDEIAEVFMVCFVCKKPGTVVCNHCNVVRYCGIECQKKDFTTHKRDCAKYKKNSK